MTDHCRICGSPSVLMEDWRPGDREPRIVSAGLCWGCLATSEGAEL